MSIEEEVRATPSFRWRAGALAVSTKGYRIHVRVTDSNHHMVERATVPVLKDWGTVGLLMDLVSNHPTVYRVTRMAFGHSSMPEKAAQVEVSLHKETGFSCSGESLGEVLAQVLVHLDKMEDQ